MVIFADARGLALPQVSVHRPSINPLLFCRQCILLETRCGYLSIAFWVNVRFHACASPSNLILVSGHWLCIDCLNV
jgi:hypothetical protein